KKLFKKNHLFDISESNDFLEEITQENILLLYFDTIADFYSVEWDNKEYLLCKYIGVSALLSLLELIVKDLKQNGITVVDDAGLRVQKENLNPYIEKLRVYDFSAKAEKASGKTYVGEAGANDMFKKISAIVFPSL
ncbi:MAG TPA: hypothetical protein VD794_10935, partial [Flavisolibacter sp.]|nr:hypothetical protein [Flavisolibacter sp.]